MEKKDKLTLVIFILLIIGIISVLGINLYKNKKIDTINRKVEYIFGYSYDSVFNKGSNLFLQTIELLNNKDVFEYEKNLDKSIKHYAIDGITNYKKIHNFSIAKNTFSNSALDEYMDLKKIIHFENSYYMEDNNFKLNNNYIGSIIDIYKYEDNKVYFKNTNYFCDNYDYLGIIYEHPDCSYTKNDSMFMIELEGNLFKISTIKDFEFLEK